MKRLTSTRTLTLSAGAVLLFLVSVPRVHQLAVQDNERDAKTTVRRAASLVLAGDSQTIAEAHHSIKALCVELQTQLIDVRYDSGAQLIRRHGYFIDLCRDGRGQELVRAWPVQCGRTGMRAYIYAPAQGLQVR